MTTSVCFMNRRTFGLTVGTLSVCLSLCGMMLFIENRRYVDEVAEILTSNSSNITVDELDYVRIHLMVYNLLNIFVSFALVVGVLKEIHCLLLPWLLNNGLLLGVASVGFMYILPSLDVFLLPLILYFMILLALEWYLFRNILSLYKEFKEASKIRTQMTAQDTNSHAPNAPSYGLVRSI